MIPYIPTFLAWRELPPLLKVAELAIEAGWFVAEYGRQPWVVEGVLPTFYAASGLNVWDLVISITFFIALYTILAVIMVWLMVRVIRQGPSDRSVLDLGDDRAPAANPEPAE